MTAKEFIYSRSQELSEAIDNGYDLRLSEPDILYWMEKYAEYKAKKLPIHNVSDTLIAWEQFKKANWYKSEAIDVEKMLMDKFQAIYGR